MEINKIGILILVGVFLMARIDFLIWENQKDKKLLNPDSENALKELQIDQERNAD